MQFFLLWEAALSPATHTSVDDKDVFAFQNDTRYKRITWLMNTARLYPLIYHFIGNPHLQPQQRCHATQRPTLSCLKSSDSI